ncbi:MAG: hypothetical protein R3C05_01890 [Pirellulaceae bacterium]
MVRQWRWQSRVPANTIVCRPAKPHAQVHRATQEVLQSVQENTTWNRETIVDALQSMEEASEQVFDYLDRILAEKCY